MMTFTVYSIVMRYFFEDPPVWGDLLTLFSKIWRVLLALAALVPENRTGS
jgi:TRAP-type C4-dicarboxylate transport system permease small subunit